jgi:hypothetical protein
MSDSLEALMSQQGGKVAPKATPKTTPGAKDLNAIMSAAGATGAVDTNDIYQRALSNPMSLTQEELQSLPKEQRDKIAQYQIAQMNGFSPQDLEAAKATPLAQELADPRTYQLPQANQILPQLEQNLGVAGRGAVQGAAAPIGMVMDPIYQLFGLPSFSKSLEQSLTMAGVPEAKSAVQRIMQNTVAGMSGAGTYMKAGEAMAQGALNPNLLQRVGQSMTEQPGMQLASGAAGGAAGQTAGGRSPSGPNGRHSWRFYWCWSRDAT